MSDRPEDSTNFEEVPLDHLPSGERTPLNLQVAIVATLLEAGHANGNFRPEELMKLSAGIFSHLGLADAEIGHLIEVSEILRQDDVKRDRLLAEVGEHFSPAQRQAILSIVWRILIIDGQVDADEAQVAVKIRKALNLSLEAAVAARIKAEQNEARLLAHSAQHPDLAVEEQEESEEE